MTAEQVKLLSMTISLLAVMISGAVVSAWIFRNVFNFPIIIVGFLLTIGMIFVMIEIAKSDDVIVIFTVAFMFGFVVGINLGGFTKLVTRGSNRATEAVVITLTIMMISTLMAAIIGLLSGFDFSGFDGVLSAVLISLIGISLFGLFFTLHRTVEFFVGVFASIFWVMYMVYHFNLIVIKYEDATWLAASEIAMSLLLDMVNLFVRLLPIIVRILEVVD